MNLRNLGPCLVCGQDAIGINFGVATCMPCKAFFRRNAVKLGRVDFICHLSGDCSVTSKTRNICNCCRLAKCFRVGMQRSLIRTDAERQGWKDIVQQNRDKRTQQSALIQRLNLNQLTSISRIKQNYSDLFSSYDQTLLTNIFGAYRQIYVLTDKCEYSFLPTEVYFSPHTFFNSYNERHRLLIDYCKLSPEFNRLSTDDKMCLIRGHFGGMFGINQAILTRSVHENLIKSFKNIFQPDLADDLAKIAERLVMYSYDPIQLKLVLIIILLSTGIHRYRTDIENDRIYDDTLKIFHGQNIYVELLWRYLLSRLPSERDAVKIFNQLVLDIIFSESSCLAVERFMYNLDHEIDQMQPLMQDLWNISNKKNKTDDDDDDSVNEKSSQ